MELERRMGNGIQLGDMLVTRRFSPKMLKALATIAMRLHPGYDGFAETVKGKSKESCLFSSLVVRRFLVSVGFADATVQPCTVYLRSERAGQELWSVGIGMPDKRVVPGRFNGHAVVSVPSERILIDTTLYQAIRPHWHGALTGMMAVSLDTPTPMVTGLSRLAGFEVQADDFAFAIAWGDRPDINWRREIDVFDPRSLNRQRRLAKVLQDSFGEWHE